MARSTNEIYTSLINFKNAQPALAVLDSNSATAIWQLLLYIVAQSQNISEQLFDAYKADLQALIDANIVPTAQWLQNMVLQFQYGDTITIINGTVQYPVVDTTKQIITAVSLRTEGNGRTLIKVAKSNPLQALDTSEINALRSYIDRIQVPGSYIQTDSYDPDQLMLNAIIYYDGQYTLSTTQTAVEAAITAYLANLEFGGIMVYLQLIDAIQAVAGVKDVFVSRCWCRDYATPITSVAKTLIVDQVSGQSTQYTARYNSLAGYIVPETTLGYTLSDQLTYQIL